MTLRAAVLYSLLFLALFSLTVFVSDYFVLCFFIPLIRLIASCRGRACWALLAGNGLVSGLVLALWVFDYNRLYFFVALSIWLAFFFSYVLGARWLSSSHARLPHWLAHVVAWLVAGYALQALSLGAYWNEAAMFFPMTSFLVMTVGGTGVAALLVAMQSLFAFGLQDRDWRQLVAATAVLALLLAGHLHARLARDYGADSLKVAVVQGNFPQTWEWRQAHAGLVLDRYLELSRAADRLSPDLILWPEYAIGVDFINGPSPLGDTLFQAAAHFNGSMLVGTILNAQQPDTHYDAALVIAGGRVLETYASVAPIAMNRNTVASTNSLAPLMSIGGAGVLICYEELNPDLVRQYSRNGARYLVGMSNNQGFGYGMDLLLRFSALRAAESFKSMVRATNTGISAVINPYGQVEAIIPAERSGTLVAHADLNDVQTLYSRYGDIPLLSLLGVLALWLRLRPSRP